MRMKKVLKIQGGQVCMEHQNCAQVGRHHERFEYQERIEKGKEASAPQKLDDYQGGDVVEG